MRNLKKFARAFALAMALTMAVPAGLPASNAVVAEAATVKLSASKKTLTVGKTCTLKMTGTKKKVTWTSSKKAVATVSSKGKVTAKKAGTATITAKVGTKSYKCKVTVKNAVNKYVAKAPFEAKEAKLGKYTMAVPKDWVVDSAEQAGVSASVVAPKGVDTSSDLFTGIIAIDSKNEDIKQTDYEIYKAVLAETTTKEAVEASLAAWGENGKITEFEFTEKETNLGKAVYISCAGEFEVEGVKKTFTQCVYTMVLDGHVLMITANEYEAESTPNVYEAADYLINSLIYVK